MFFRLVLTLCVVMLRTVYNIDQHIVCLVITMSNYNNYIYARTKVMRIGRKQVVCNVEVNGQKVEQVEVMTYLGSMISSNGSMDNEVEQRIGMASK